MGLSYSYNTVEGILQCFDLLHYLPIILSIEWRCGCCKDVKDHTSRPDVAPFIIIELDNFRGNVIRSSHKFVILRDSKFFSHAVFPLIGQSKVDEFHTKILLGVHHKVLRFQVTMRYFFGVQIFDDFNNLRKDLASVILVKIASSVQSLKEFSSFAVTK